MSLGDAGRGVDNAACAVELRRVQRTRLGHDREVFNRADNPVIVQRLRGCLCSSASS